MQTEFGGSEKGSAVSNNGVVEVQAGLSHQGLTIEML